MQKKYKILVYLFLLITAATNASAQCAITITQQPVLPALVCVTPGTSETIAVTATINAGGSLTYQWYFNDNLIGGATQSSFAVPRQISSNGRYRVKISGICADLSTNELLSNEVTLTLGNVPSITSALTDQSVCIGTPLNLSATASSNNGGTLSYLWEHTSSFTNTVAASTYSVASFLSSNAGQYRFTATNGCGSTTSNTINITSKDKPVSLAVNNPSVISSCVSNPILLETSINSNNGGTATYQWYKVNSGSDITISGATNSFYQINSIQITDAGVYKMRASNSCGAAVNYAEFSLNNPATKPVITVQPTLGSQTICINQTITLQFSASAQNSPALQYKWFKNNTEITGQTGTSLNLTQIQAANQGDYKAEVSNTCGVTATNIISVNPGGAPKDITQSADLTACYGTAVALQVNANSNNGGLLSYQWISSSEGNLVNNSANYSIANFQSNKAGTYLVDISNACGTTRINSPITLTGKALPQIISVESNGSVFCAGASLSLKVTTSNEAGLLFAWYKGLELITRETNNYYQKGGLIRTDGANYSVRVSNSCGTVSSSAITIAVNDRPTITSDITKSLDCSGSKELRFVVAGADNGGGTISYQ